MKKIIAISIRLIINKNFLNKIVGAKYEKAYNYTSV